MTRPTSVFKKNRSICFYETDAMGVVHHSNYMRFFEELRLDWLKEKGLLQWHYPRQDLVLAVVEGRCLHKKPLFLDDEIEIFAQIRLERLKIRFQYAIYSSRYNDPVALGETLHVALDSQFRVKRLPPALQQELEKEIWKETWL